MIWYSITIDVGLNEIKKKKKIWRSTIYETIILDSIEISHLRIFWKWEKISKTIQFHLETKINQSLKLKEEHQTRAKQQRSGVCLLMMTAIAETIYFLSRFSVNWSKEPDESLLYIISVYSLTLILIFYHDFHKFHSFFPQSFDFASSLQGI